MDRGDDISEPATLPLPKPPSPDGGGSSDLVSAEFERLAPRPMPPRAFLEPTTCDGPCRPLSPEVTDDVLIDDARQQPPHSYADPFSEISAEASVSSAKAFIEELSRAAPSPAELYAEDQSAVMAPRPAVEPPVLSIPDLGEERLAANIASPLREARPSDAQNDRSIGRHVAWRVVRFAGRAAACWLAVVLALIALYRFINPPVSALMLQKMLVGQSIAHEWVPIENMSPNIVRAVLLSEDGRFCEHNGVDYEALQQAVEQAANGGSRGASTISMQVIKNLFLWPSKSYLRKAIEFPLTYVMELVWPKRRIMEIYLNIAEWGPGIFGVQQAAEYHFNKTAWGLTAQEAARLAVALPNPIARDAGDPGYGTQRLANAVQVRMRLAPSSQLACVLSKRRI